MLRDGISACRLRTLCERAKYPNSRREGCTGSRFIKRTNSEELTTSPTTIWTVPCCDMASNSQGQTARQPKPGSAVSGQRLLSPDIALNSNLPLAQTLPRSMDLPNEGPSSLTSGPPVALQLRTAFPGPGTFDKSDPSTLPTRRRPHSRVLR